MASMLTVKQQTLVESYLPYAKRCARAMARKSPMASYDDLAQEACLGLIEAARRFKPSRGYKFETFARPRIDGAMLDSLRRGSWPRGIRKMRRRIASIREEFAEQTGKLPTIEDLAEHLKMSPGHLMRWVRRIAVIEMTAPDASLEGVDPTCMPRIMMPMASTAADTAHSKDVRRHRLLLLVMDVPPREARLIWLYYFEEHTMGAIAKVLGVNESRVSQLHARAIGRLREMAGEEDLWAAA